MLQKSNCPAGPTVINYRVINCDRDCGPANIVTGDGGGAHANSRWNEELVRTERERERELWHGNFI